MAKLRTRGGLLGLVGLTAGLNLWGLSLNGWANPYYSAAVRSMSTSWHDFLFASLDKSGLMTVDKPPLSLWVQALSARVFGFHALSLLVPQALEGVAAVALTYDLVRRRFGHPAGLVAGLTLATTPVAVAVSRHNNPDELLVLCSVTAVWCALRALDSGRTRWLLLSGVAVGLGFETKMGVALMVVPGIAAAWMWAASRGGVAALRQLLAGGAAMALVGGAWPLLVVLTPAAERPWISDTSDNNILSLIFGFNGFGRLVGEAGGPQTFAGSAHGDGAIAAGAMSGGAAGPFRLLQSGLGDQAGWLLGFALIAGLGLLLASRLRRSDPRSAWLIIVGGTLLSGGVAFSFAQGIFHPYYLSLLAPFTAALVGAGSSQMLSGRQAARIFAPLALAGGAVTELIVLNELNGQLGWAPLVIVVGAAACAVVLMLRLAARTRASVVAAALAILLAAPAAWAAQTPGHAGGPFPSGGPASAAVSGGPAGPGLPGRSGLPGGPGSPRGPGLPGGPGYLPGWPELPGGPGSGALPPGLGAPGAGGPGAPGGIGPDSASLAAAVRYAAAHGGGTIGVSSQSTAASAILSSNANVAGLGGFSGRESSVRVPWLADEIASGRLRWLIADRSRHVTATRDPRTGSAAAITFATRLCRAVPLARTATPGASAVTMYDCSGRAATLLRALGS